MSSADRDAARRRLHRVAAASADLERADASPIPEDLGRVGGSPISRDPGRAGGSPISRDPDRAEGPPIPVDPERAGRPELSARASGGPAVSPGDPAGDPPSGWVPGAALRTAAARYSWEHPGDDRHTDDDPPPGGVRRAPDGPRVRWAVPWRVAGTAALVVALVAGAAALRSAASTPGAAVELPEPAPVGSAAAVEEAGGPPAESPSAGVVVVHVVGAVAAPGVVRLPGGARVEDAVAAAGGPAPDADLGRVNLARVLVDGEQIVVPRPGETAPTPAGGGQAAAGAVGGAPVDLNAASLAQLDALPGVGPVLAQRILDRRPYSSVDELDEVSGIGATLLERLRPLVRV